MRPIRRSDLIKICCLLILGLTIMAFNGRSKMVTYRSDFCQCSRSILVESDATDVSADWCSEESLLRGTSQNIVAYSLYGEAIKDHKLSRYFLLIADLPEQVKRFYPGWTIRIYHNLDRNRPLEHKMLCDVYCRNSHVDLCSIPRLVRIWRPFKRPLSRQLSRLNPRKWRYLALLDPSVDRFMARDIDSEINSREHAAVDQWLQSAFTFHVMRDHQFHVYPIMAGMFGAKVEQKRDVIHALTKALVSLGTNHQLFEDQILLAKIFWPTVKDDAMIHDSYFCRHDWDSVPPRPFPTRRVNASFVSDRTGADWDRPKPCPAACRPPDHPDWNFC